MILKCGRREFTVGKKDQILDNGAVYQLITQTYYKDWMHINPKVSKTTFNNLLKNGKIRLSEKKYKSDYGTGKNCKLYEFTED